jgi:hypothetical protein
MIDEERVRQRIADRLDVDVDLAVEPLRIERLRERVGLELVILRRFRRLSNVACRTAPGLR